MTSPSKNETPQPGNTKVTRADWLTAARLVLLSNGVDHVRILPLAGRLNVSRSSFYWYFLDRAHLLTELVEDWRNTNTHEIVTLAARPSRDICGAVLNIFECWTDHSAFDPRIDFAIREWSRRDDAVRMILLKEDAKRIDAIAGAYRRHEFSAKEAFIRARVLYFTQIGYYTLDLHERVEDRLQYTREYILSFTGQQPSENDVLRFQAFVRKASGAQLADGS